MSKQVKRKRSLKKIIGLTALLSLVLIQFIPVDRSVPVVEASQDILTIHKPTDDVASLFRTACYDCHSYESEYPSYSNIAPVSFWMQGHIKGARNNVNFSTWADLASAKKTQKIKESIDKIKAGHMPISSYKLMHKDARLTENQKKLLTDWLSSL